MKIYSDDDIARVKEALAGAYEVLDAGSINTLNQVTEALAILDAGKSVEVVGYLAWRDGKPVWDEDCVCEDPVYPLHDDDDRTSKPIFATKEDV